ncbi:MAG: amidohydrolase [Bacteroides sp.]|nr:amidohydrolase [Clostridia bacterium]
MSLVIDETEQKILDLIDEKRDVIIDFAKDIYTHAELGYKEYRTSEKFAGLMEQLGLNTKKELAVTGVKAYLNEEKKDNVSLALIGELDALRIPAHKYANPETQAAHCCGHHAQLAGVIGAALALTDEAVKEKLDGQVVFFAVPAEEYGEIEFKNRLTAEGKIKYGGGKCELIRVGAFDDIDLDIVHHTGEDDISVGSVSNNGFVSKVIRYQGVAAHAAAAPHLGVNALNAASLGLSALAYQRETFKDEDSVRVHPIITKGGNLVNVVPDEVIVETLVRASNKDAIIDAANKTDRAFKSGAIGIGAKCEITTMPGYLPTIKSEADEDVLAAAYIAAQSAGKNYNVVKRDINVHDGGSTDVGDVQHIQPVLTFNTGGKVSGLHAVDFDIADEELAYIVTAKIFALSAYRLLKDGAVKAKNIVKNYKPKMTKEEYIEYMDSFIKVENV